MGEGGAMGRRRGAAAAGAVLLATVLAGCGGDGGSGGAAGPSVRDSAGISIVENRAPTWAAGEAWMVDAEPLLSIGTLDGPQETQFFELSAVRLRSDGSLVAAEEGGRRILAFDPAGEFLWTQGRDGDGPGEYRRPASLMVLPGDSVLVYDTQHRRVTVLAPGGEVARSYQPEVPEGSFMNGPVGLVGPGLTLTNGGAVFGDGGEGTDGRVERRVARHFLTGTDGRVRDSLPALPGTEFWLVANQDFVSIWGLPFGKGSQAAGGGGLVAMGVTEAAEWRILDDTGALNRVVRLEVEPRPVTGEDWDRAQEAQLPDDAGAEQRAQMREVFAGVPIPDRWPVFSDLLLDDTGHLWVRGYPAPWDGDAPGRWWVFDPAGTLLGEVGFPAGLEVDEIRGDQVVGRWTDELGVERIRIHRIVGRPVR